MPIALRVLQSGTVDVSHLCRTILEVPANTNQTLAQSRDLIVGTEPYSADGLTQAREHGEWRRSESRMELEKRAPA